MRRLLESLIELVYPPRCCICHTPSRLDLCELCLAGVDLFSDDTCDRCGRPLERDRSCPDCRSWEMWITSARCLGPYDGHLKNAIHEFKYGRRRGLAGQLVGIAPEDARSRWTTVNVITAVPLSLRKRRARGYNQSSLIAESVSAICGRPVAALLAQVVETDDQTKLSAQEREMNVRNAFVVTDERLVEGKSILLVDDVLTTGATANECARTLKAAGADAVHAFTLARAMGTPSASRAGSAAERSESRANGSGATRPQGVGRI